MRTDDERVALGLLSDRRKELVDLRTQAVNRVHRLLVELVPGGASRRLSVSKSMPVSCPASL